MISTRYAQRRAMLLLLITLLAWGCIVPAQGAHILVDIGHTPEQPGATGASGRVEYLYNRDLGLAIIHALTALGDTTIRIAAPNKSLTLAQRTAIAPEADFLVSIHHDSIQAQYLEAGRQHEFAGYSIFVSKRNTHYEHSLGCAQAIGGQLLATGEQPSRYHAEHIDGENRPFVDSIRGVHRFDDLVVLHTAPMPAVLVEAGVIINPSEEVRLSSPHTIKRLAQAIARGVHICTTAQ